MHGCPYCIGGHLARSPYCTSMRQSPAQRRQWLSTGRAVGVPHDCGLTCGLACGHIVRWPCFTGGHTARVTILCGLTCGLPCGTTCGTTQCQQWAAPNTQCRQTEPIVGSNPCTSVTCHSATCRSATCRSATCCSATCRSTTCRSTDCRHQQSLPRVSAASPCQHSAPTVPAKSRGDPCNTATHGGPSGFANTTMRCQPFCAIRPPLQCGRPCNVATHATWPPVQYGHLCNMATCVIWLSVQYGHTCHTAGRAIWPPVQYGYPRIGHRYHSLNVKLRPTAASRACALTHHRVHAPHSRGRVRA